jgi:hypothetical protein
MNKLTLDTRLYHAILVTVNRYMENTNMYSNKLSVGQMYKFLRALKQNESVQMRAFVITRVVEGWNVKHMNGSAFLYVGTMRNEFTAHLSFVVNFLQLQQNH